MAKTREIKGRLKAVGNIKRITKTMQVIATTRFNKAQRSATASKPYTEKIAQLVDDLAKAAGGESGISHPLLKAPDPAVGKELLLVLTSSRGLCGGYNANVLRRMNAFLQEHGRDNVEVEMVGKKGRGYCRFSGIELAKYHDQFGENVEFEKVEQLADDYIARFTAGEFDAVHVVYMKFETMGRQAPNAIQLLPLEDPAGEEEAEAEGPQAAVAYEFSPDPETLLGELLPITVKTELLQCFNDATVSEHIARMVAMKNATDSAEKMNKDLSRRYNRARQAAITTELTEIISGVAALS